MVCDGADIVAPSRFHSNIEAAKYELLAKKIGCKLPAEKADRNIFDFVTFEA